MSTELQEVKNVLLHVASVPTAERRVTSSLEEISGDPTKFLTFMNQYASWNSEFGGGVASLTSLISQNPRHFQESGFPPDLADRATYVASYIFDAARDEYDDHINSKRDTHRTLAQAMLLGMQKFYDLSDDVFSQGRPLWLHNLARNVVDGYVGGMSTPNDIYAAFRGLGYHLGSEMLADREFSLIDTHYRSVHPELFEFLKRKTIIVAGVSHRAYSWIGIHSGQGGGAEADHFDFGLQGTAKALKFLVDADREACLRAVAEGFKRFDDDHAYFFEAAIENLA